MTPRRRVVLYTTPFCAECERARALLERRGNRWLAELAALDRAGGVEVAASAMVR